MRLTVAFCALLSTTALAAQPAQPVTPDRSEIIVQGARDRDKQIQQFIKDLTPAPIRGQLARFELPVCPLVIGIADNQAHEVEERMRRVAAAAGIPVAKPGCLTNMAVFITPNKAELLNYLQRWPNMFPDDWSQSQIKELKHNPSPVAAWHTVQEVWQDGIPLSARETTAPDPRELTTLLLHAIATRLQPSAHPTFNKSVLIIQTDALAGLTPIEVADYAAMRSFVRTDPKGLRPTAAGSILSILDTPLGSAVPLTLTQWDLSFLRSFYASTKNMYAEYQRAQMKVEMKRELDRQQTAKP